jgi:hypothetical protein
MQPLVALVRKEFLQFFRRTPLVILVVWTMAIEIALCAYAITYSVGTLVVYRSIAYFSLDREIQATLG